MTVVSAQDQLQRLYWVAVAAASPARGVRLALESLQSEPTLVLAAGKTGADMAEAAIAAGVRPRGGLVVVRAGEGRGIAGLEVKEASHPLPDDASVKAGRRMLSIAKAARAEDHVLVLLSGGGSALLCAPGPGLALSRKRVVTQALIRSGATIQEINLVRRRLSAIKGGRLAAAAAPARITTLAVSDVIGDAPEDIASGPTAPDPTTMDQALHVLDHYGIAVPDAGWSESLKQGDLAFARSTYRVIASSAGSLKAVRDASEAAGYHAVDLGEALQGEARATGFAHAKAVETYCAKSGRYALISGGELTVRVSGGGRGGPNFEYAAALASRIEGLEGVFGLAADTDGLDGNAEAAGAFFSGASAEAARKAGLSFEQALDTNDAGGAFERIGGVFAPGPTGTNVNDVRIILISR